MFFVLSPHLFLDYFDIKLIKFLSSKKVSKNDNRNSAHRYLPEIPFVPQTDNGTLGVKIGKYSNF